MSALSSSAARFAPALSRSLAFKWTGACSRWVRLAKCGFQTEVVGGEDIGVQRGVGILERVNCAVGFSLSNALGTAAEIP